jgi:hypothetical protein
VTRPTRSRTTGVRSKRLTGKLCAYCPAPAATWDHVFAKKFFLPTRRADLPQVPACELCNRNKRDLEAYLMTVLPFGGQHRDALDNLQTMVPPRLVENKKLHQMIAQNTSEVLTLTRFGLRPTMALSIEWEKLIELFEYVVRGLMFFHWRVRLTSEHCWYVVPSHSDPGFDRLLDGWVRGAAKARVGRNLGDGTFLYEGVQATENDALSAWRFWIYGGQKVAVGAGEIIQHLGALTGPRRMFEKAEPPSG